MQTFKPEDYIINTDHFTSTEILLKFLEVNLRYYKQQGLADTIKLDIKDNGRALAIAYFMIKLKNERPVWESPFNEEPILAFEFIQCAISIFAKFATMIREIFKGNRDEAEKVVKEYYGYLSEAAVPILMCGDYDNSAKWELEYSSVD